MGQKALGLRADCLHYVIRESEVVSDLGVVEGSLCHIVDHVQGALHVQLVAGAAASATLL